MSIAIKKQPRPLPSSQAYSDLQRRACETVLLPRDPNSLRIAGEAINDGLRRMNTRRWNWSIRQRIITVVADKRDYPVPTDFASVSDGTWLDINQESSYPVIEYLDPINFGRLFIMLNPRPKESYHFTVRNEYEFTDPLRLAYPLDASLVQKHPFLRLMYYSNLPRLEAPGDTFQAPSEIELWVLAYAEAKMARVYAPSRYSSSRREAEILWTEILKSDRRRGHHAI